MHISAALWKAGLVPGGIFLGLTVFFSLFTMVRLRTTGAGRGSN